MKQRGPSRGDMEFLWSRRWKARSDLEWLCKNVLDYTLVDHDVHGPMIAHLQQFPLPPKEIARQKDMILDTGKFKYMPGDPYVELEGWRRRMLLFSRGYFKTTVNTIAHAIQWLLNYPQISMALLFSVDSKAQDILKNSIKHHFQYNPKLRELFPEYCPQKRIADWGNAESFILPNRDVIRDLLQLPPRVEDSVSSQSLDKSQAGYHFDIIKCSDIVEENNVQTPAQRAQVLKRFGLLDKMLVKRPDGLDGWLDLEGTFYHPEDLHSVMIKHWLEEYSQGQSHSWQIFVNGCFQRDTKGMPRNYDPWEMKYCPFLLDENGKRCPTWPSADPIEKLEKEEADPIVGGYTFATQRILDISADKSGNRPFADPVTYISREDFKRVPIVYHVTTVDLADTDGPKSNYSVILTAGYDRAGRAYVHDIQRGRWGPDEVVQRMFKTFTRFRPRRVVVEDYAYVHGLKPTIDRVSHMHGVYPPFEYVPADRGTRKIQKIMNALQGPFRRGINGEADLRFVDPLDAADDSNNKTLRNALETEFAECTVFSTGSTDDILDALASQFLTREWSGTENLGGAEAKLTPEAYLRLLDKQYGQDPTEREYKAAFRRMVFPEPAASDSGPPDPYRQATGW